MDSIRQWLNGPRSYTVGAALYQAHGSDELLKAALRQGESPYRKKRLIDALTALYNERKKPVPSGTAPKVAGGGHEPAPSSPANKTAPSISRGLPPPDHERDPYFYQWSPLYKEMLLLHSRLTLYPNDRERGEAAFRILELEKACRYYWRRRDYFLQHGAHMPEDSGKPDLVTDRNKLIERRNTLRTYKSRLSASLKKDPHNITLRERLDKYLYELEEVEKQLEKK